MDGSVDNLFPDGSSDDGGRSREFPTTKWSVVLAAGNGDLSVAARALERLCSRYWNPVYAFVRKRGSNPHESEDLTQSFFCHILEEHTLLRADPNKGKFRSFLLGSLNNFLNNERDKQRTIKRGGQKQFVSLDDAQAEEFYSHEPAHLLTPERMFERRWAATLMEHVFARLKREYIKDGKTDLFDALGPGLTGEVEPGVYAEWAFALRLNEGALRVALHRLRRRFGELLRSEIAHTVSRPEEVEEEIRHLFAVISIS